MDRFDRDFRGNRWVMFLLAIAKLLFFVVLIWGGLIWLVVPA